VRLKKIAYSRIVLLTVTLESLDAFVTHVSDLSTLKIYPEGAVPWSVYIHDLRVICEMCEGAGQLLHYIERRQKLETVQISAHDELDWFGHYLSRGLYFENESGEATPMHLLTHTTSFDDYFLYKAGIRRTPTAKPRQPMPSELRTLMSDLEYRGPSGFVDAVCSLLEGDQQAREALAEIIRTRKGRAKRAAFSGGRISVGDLLIVYLSMRSPGMSLLDEYTRAAKYLERKNYAIGIARSPTRGREVIVSVHSYPWVENWSMRSRAEGFFAGLRSRQTDLT
jgi:hypothetical protein